MGGLGNGSKWVWVEMARFFSTGQNGPGFVDKSKWVLVETGQLLV